eukprot:TRINITY_DN5045_c0_g1_i4.p1 TRINITY_DN5045_c0_g1~~TRINITY_DN5045_c0_g1_i4.p1  ORF type:complete len:163 (-),score=15.66 TRINITY_DN5045_c0_g1_i4:3-491(-)
MGSGSSVLKSPERTVLEVGLHLHRLGYPERIEVCLAPSGLFWRCRIGNLSYSSSEERNYFKWGNSYCSSVELAKQVIDKAKLKKKEFSQLDYLYMCWYNNACHLVGDSVFYEYADWPMNECGIAGSKSISIPFWSDVESMWNKESKIHPFCSNAAALINTNK